jgi:hypothetical protein
MRMECNKRNLSLKSIVTTDLSFAVNFGEFMTRQIGSAFGKMIGQVKQPLTAYGLVLCRDPIQKEETNKGRVISPLTVLALYYQFQRKNQSGRIELVYVAVES